METILSVKDLSISFTLRGQQLNVIRGVSVDVRKAESLAIVGESGSGKSVFCKALMGLLDANGHIDAGEIIYNGVDLAALKSERDWLNIRGKEIAIIMQDPMTSLNPLKTVGSQVTEAVALHQKLAGKAARDASIEYLRDVGIPQPDKRYRQYPHEFSGGMRQRVVIAIAIACRPKILICDEPTTAIDVTIQAQILELLKQLKRKYELTIIYITHDLGVVADVAERIAVMYAGDFVEIGSSRDVFYGPRHPYTRALLASMPQLASKGELLHSIDGSPPDLSLPTAGDAFAPRNPNALKIDFVKRPPMFRISPTHSARTWLLDDRSPFKDASAYEAAQGKVKEKTNAARTPHAGDDTRAPLTAEAAKAPQAADAAKAPSAAYAAKDEPILEVRGLTVRFGKGRNKLDAVKNVNFSVNKGETFGVVGESGSGKTTLGRTIMRIYEPTEGEIIFKGKRVSGRITRAEDIQLTRGIQMIFQDPMSSLNERAKILNIVAEGLLNIGRTNRAERSEMVFRSLTEVGLRPESADRFPHEFSGGQRQRIGIARAMIMSPEFIIADEPVSALDVSVRAQALNLMSGLQREKGLSYLFISHDLSVMRFICDRIAALYRGVMVELADTETLFKRPLHPYTKSLISAIPQPDPDAEQNKTIISYDSSQHKYDKEPPTWREVEPGHFVYCNDREEEAIKKQA